MREIKHYCETFQAELECLLPTEGNACTERAIEIAAMHANIGHLLAKAKLAYRTKKSSEIANTILKIAKEQYLSSKSQNALIDSIAQEEAYLVDWLDRLNSMCVHQMDLLRTFISKEKAEMQMANFGGGGRN